MTSGPCVRGGEELKKKANDMVLDIKMLTNIEKYTYTDRDLKYYKIMCVVFIERERVLMYVAACKVK